MREVSLPRRYRTTTRKTVTVAWLAGLAIAAFLLKTWIEPFPLWLQTTTTIVCAAVYVFALCVAPRTFTNVDGEGICLRAVVRTRRLGWADIYDIRTVTPPSPSVGERATPARVVYAYRSDGRRVLLPNLDPNELGEERFSREAAALRALLEERRAPGWVPDPRVEADIAQHEARYAKRYRALTGRISLTLFVLVVLAVIITGTTIF
ncbi:PH domain-containing protein [Streptomyces sp. NPDC058674]|uniref:PH domain-containing protein n=1 Tax=Streptomyces sp. NPDC058674 TaxID=3346592 RepID=UPI00364D0C7D